MAIRLNEFTEEQQRRPAPRGWYERITETLTDKQRLDLDEAIADKHVSGQTISVVLKRWGYDVSYQQVGNYRRRNVT